MSVDKSFHGGLVLEEGYTLEDSLGSVGDGWADLVRAFYQACTDAGIKIVQVKEKFGGLRMYTDYPPAHIRKLEVEMETKSLKTCEPCGKPGKPTTNNYWIKTVCEECDVKRQV